MGETLQDQQSIDALEKTLELISAQERRNRPNTEGEIYGNTNFIGRLKTERETLEDIYNLPDITEESNIDQKKPEVDLSRYLTNKTSPQKAVRLSPQQEQFIEGVEPTIQTTDSIKQRERVSPIPTTGELTQIHKMTEQDVQNIAGIDKIRFQESQSKLDELQRRQKRRMSRNNQSN